MSEPPIVGTIFSPGFTESGPGPRPPNFYEPFLFRLPDGKVRFVEERGTFDCSEEELVRYLEGYDCWGENDEFVWFGPEQADYFVCSWRRPGEQPVYIHERDLERQIQEHDLLCLAWARVLWAMRNYARAIDFVIAVVGVGVEIDPQNLWHYLEFLANGERPPDDWENYWPAEANPRLRLDEIVEAGRCFFAPTSSLLIG